MKLNKKGTTITAIAKIVRIQQITKPYIREGDRKLVPVALVVVKSV